MSDQETAAIIVMRTSDAKKVEFEMNMSGSLNDLKDTIDGSADFGPLSRDKQRIFHLGRELKTGGRSLSALGLGRFQVFTVHLLAKSIPPNGAAAKDDDDQVVEVLAKQRGRTRSRRPNAHNPPPPQQQQAVIELSDDDDDDDEEEEEDVVEVTLPPRKRRRTQR